MAKLFCHARFFVSKTDGAARTFETKQPFYGPYGPSGQNGQQALYPDILKSVIVSFFVKVVQTAVAHRGQSRALRLCRLGRVQRYTSAPYSLQNTTLLHAASTDRR